MSYPTDGLPRFKVVGPHGAPGEGGYVARVLDRADTHRYVAACHSNSLITCAAMAAAKAVRLNLEMDPQFVEKVDEEALAA